MYSTPISLRLSGSKLITPPHSVSTKQIQTHSSVSTQKQFKLTNSSVSTPKQFKLTNSSVSTQKHITKIYIKKKKKVKKSTQKIGWGYHKDKQIPYL